MTAAPKGTEPRTFRPVSAAVDAIAAAWECDLLAAATPPLREAAWTGFTAEVRRFITDADLLAAIGLSELLHHAFTTANASFLDGADGGPWWAFLTEYGHLVAAADALAEAEAIVEEVRE